MKDRTSSNGMIHDMVDRNPITKDRNSSNGTVRRTYYISGVNTKCQKPFLSIFRNEEFCETKKSKF